jgi:hypothetical protein
VPNNPEHDSTAYGVLGAVLVVVLDPEPVVSVSAGLQPTSAKQAASVSNAISFIFELLLFPGFPMCQRPGLLGRLALSRRTFTHCYNVAKPFFYPPRQNPKCQNPSTKEIPGSKTQ